MNLYLIGYRGAGKSTAARLLGEQLGRPWCDADALLEEKAGRTIRDIFADEAETGFRDREAAILRELASREAWIVATGGGVVLREENRSLLKKGQVVWLTASAETLWVRLRQDDTTAQRRPNLTKGGLKEIRDLLKIRAPLYEECAHFQVSTEDQAPGEVAQRVLDWLTKVSPGERRR